MRKKRLGIEHYYDSVIYSPSYVKLKKLLHDSNYLYYKIPMRIKRLEWFSKILQHIPLPFSPTTYFKLEDFDIYPIAQSHLDAAWLWTVNDTKVRAYKTFYAALKHINQYPYFSVSMTSPQYFNWIKRYDPEMWERVKQQVAQNKIDTVGGMWVEPALRLCSGESLVRQRLYGQLFYLRNFGKTSKVESLLDVFGFPYSLPQILVKSGAESFWTTKLTWNDYSPFPFSNFMWRGLDGTEIFSHMFKFQIMAMIDFGLYRRMARKPRIKGLVFNSHNSLKEMNDALSDEHVRTLGLFYGKGDGGKGPIFTEIQYMENLAKFYGFKHTNTHRYFEILKEDVGDIIITWDDELYLEYHRGCLTTQARVKKGNRCSEEVVIAAECLNTTMLLTPQLDKHIYPKKLFDDCWQKILFNQFHDILPGSSIPEVYLLTWKEHDYVIENMRSMLKNCLSQIETALPRIKGDIIIYNPVSVKNDGIIKDNNDEYFIKNIEPFSVLILSKEELQKRNETYKHEISIESGKSSINVENEYLTIAVSKKSGNLIELNLKHQQAITNFLYGERNEIKESTEKLVMKDNTIKKHHLRFKGARIHAFREFMKRGQAYPAWNIDKSYTKHPLEVKLVEEPKVESFPTKAEVTSKFMIKHSYVEIKYTIRAQSDFVDVDFRIDFNDNKTLLKYFIPLNLQSENIRCEIPYGSVVRNRNPKTEMEKGKWEFGMQKWVDISDLDVGLAILNDSKYGLSANMKGISITLVRSPHYPKDPFHTREIKFKPEERPNYTDLGFHEFQLRIVPHKGNWINHRIPHKALAFNNPVISIRTKVLSQENNIPSESRLNANSCQTQGLEGYQVVLPKITSDHQNIIISTFKPSEWISKETEEFKVDKKYSNEDFDLPESPSDWIWDGKTLIIRAFECGGSQISSSLRLHHLPDSIEITAEEIDLLEYKIGKKLEVIRNSANNTIVIRTEFTPYEIKTIRLIIE
ncbi:MAG: alpha-mannosidase [Candidatus Lokiarchaeota archaeon]|nr:alpha-mannosidase [Candidatus Lokiarchaeota archaeon]